MQSAMMAAVLLLPIALAAIYPCPSSPPSPSSEDISVCASDYQLPGLSAAHPGPCAPQEVTAGRRRRYTVEYPEWQKCFNERQCDAPHWGNCTECGLDDYECNMTCSLNCGCGCMGLPTAAGLDKDAYGQWEKCCQQRGCTERKKEKCKKDCHGNQFCKNLCRMESERCRCGCVQHVVATRTSTTTATTERSSPSAIKVETSATEVETSTTEAVTNATEALSNATETVTTTTEVETNNTEGVTNATEAISSATEAVTITTEVETNNTELETSARETTATVAWTWRNYMACVYQSCDCGRDSLFPEVRRANCTCSCMGLLGSNLEVYDSAVVQKCLRDCGDQETKCNDGCRRQEQCRDNCHLSKQRCRCECNHTT